METKHTPGPWRVGDAGRTVFGPKTTDGLLPVTIAFCAHTTGDFRANARLIAAAPALLEALRGLVAQLDGPVLVHGNGCGRDGTKLGLSGEEFQALRKNRMDAARAAIAQAVQP